MRSRTRVGIAVVLLVGALSAPAAWGGARAAYDIEFAHQPGPTAWRGEDLLLAGSAFSACVSFYCGPIQVGVTYIAPDGSEQVTGTGTAVGPDATAFRATIPGAHVDGERVSYWVEAYQVRCQLWGACELSEARAPVTGVFEVGVTERPLP